MERLGILQEHLLGFLTLLLPGLPGPLKVLALLGELLPALGVLGLGDVVGLEVIRVLDGFFPTRGNDHRVIGEGIGGDSCSAYPGTSADRFRRAQLMYTGAS